MGASGADGEYEITVDGNSKDYKKSNSGSGIVDYLARGYDNAFLILRREPNNDKLHCFSCAYFICDFVREGVTYTGGTASSVTTLNIKSQTTERRHPVGTRIIAYGLRLL